MANPHPYTESQTTSERLEASRKVKTDAIAREIAWAAIVVRSGLWPAWVSVPKVDQTTFPYILNIDTPAGRLIYRLRAEELDMFRGLQILPNDGLGGGWDEKLGILTLLASEGWKK